MASTTASSTGEDVEVRERDGLPSLPPLFAKGAATTPLRRGGALPARRYVVRGLEVDRDDVARFASVCGFRLGNSHPITFPYTLGFPLGVQLMTDLAFPFPLVGLVHVRQTIEQRRAIDVGEPLDVEVWTDSLAAHPKGAQLDLVMEVSANGEMAWTGRSTYLRRGGTSVVEKEAEKPPELSAPERVTATFRVEGDTGRQFAGAAGDVNPIHLHQLTAKAFGFPRAIAHGMWTASRALAGLEGRLPAACSVDARFQAPLFLPSTVRYATGRDGDGGWAFALLPKKEGKTPHLVGRAGPLG